MKHAETNGIIGMILALLMPYIEVLHVVIQLFAGLGGLVLLGFSIYHKYLQIKDRNGNK